MTHLKLSRLTHTSIFNGEAATLLHSYMIRSVICIRLAWTNATFGKQCKTVFSSSDLIMRISWRHPCLQLKGLQWEIKGSRLFCSVLLRHLALDTRNLWCTQTQYFSRACLYSHWDTTQNPNEIELAHPGKLPSNNDILTTITTRSTHLEAGLDHQDH